MRKPLKNFLDFLEPLTDNCYLRQDELESGDVLQEFEVSFKSPKGIETLLSFSVKEVEDDKEFLDNLNKAFKAEVLFFKESIDYQVLLYFEDDTFRDNFTLKEAVLELECQGRFLDFVSYRVDYLSNLEFFVSPIITENIISGYEIVKVDEGVLNLLSYIDASVKCDIFTDKSYGEHITFYDFYSYDDYKNILLQHTYSENPEEDSDEYKEIEKELSEIKNISRLNLSPKHHLNFAGVPKYETLKEVQKFINDETNSSYYSKTFILELSYNLFLINRDLSDGLRKKYLSLHHSEMNQTDLLKSVFVASENERLTPYDLNRVFSLLYSFLDCSFYENGFLEDFTKFVNDGVVIYEGDKGSYSRLLLIKENNNEEVAKFLSENEHFFDFDSYFELVVENENNVIKTPFGHLVII